MRKLGRQLESAARDGAHFAVIVGDELANGQVQLRDLPAATQKAVHLDDLARELRAPRGRTGTARRAPESRLDGGVDLLASFRREDFARR